MLFAGLDLETTGLDPWRHQILSIGVALGREVEGCLVILTEGELRLRYTGGPVDPNALAVNGVDLSAWEGAEAGPQLRAMVALLRQAQRIFVHGPAFDWSFLQRAMSEHDVDPHVDNLIRRTSDTRSLALPLQQAGLLDSTSLADVCRFTGVSNDGAHTASTDARRALQVGVALLALYRDRFAPELRPGEGW